MKIRIGHGYDVHRLAERDAGDSRDSIALGGIQVPSKRCLVAHSDGDVLIHALCDAILGALAQGDIGKHFPDHDPEYRGIDSSRLLERVTHLAGQLGWQLVNADLTVLAQAPRLAPHIDAMRSRLAVLAGVDADAVSVKATTTEGLGPVGRGEGIACHAVVLMQRPEAA